MDNLAGGEAVEQAKEQILKDLAASGENYCVNCLRLEEFCDCGNADIWNGGKELHRHCVKCNRTEKACRCAFPELVKTETK